MKLSDNTKLILILGITLLVLGFSGVDMWGIIILTGTLGFIYLVGSFFEFIQQGCFSNYTYRQVLINNFENMAKMWGAIIVVILLLLMMTV